ncbi:uncharacterized protein LOC141904663 [Tubulanus polymorphus]|uniref:uncharacterized protein LOC141904663 n=1 Tax=Tubulanus polymorphus TaxID=672921 RepID=UPI003DA3675D
MLKYNLNVIDQPNRRTYDLVKIEPGSEHGYFTIRFKSPNETSQLTFPLWENGGLWRVCDSIGDKYRASLNINRPTRCLHYFGITVKYFKKSGTAWEFELVRSAEVCAIVALAASVISTSLCIFGMIRQQAVSMMISGVCGLAAGVYCVFTAILMHLNVSSFSEYDEVLSQTIASELVKVKLISLSWSCYLCWAVVILQLINGALILWVTQKMTQIMMNYPSKYRQLCSM